MDSCLLFEFLSTKTHILLSGLALKGHSGGLFYKTRAVCACFGLGNELSDSC